ncbi:alpha/beta hydrolase fold domain-containing protein [Yinghuangia sp. YIM S10712]|uniref:alpha/beta hydrolase fold domain-containing protein n=1 Tax=Yinghuangia sp. YIM S10712 TaxID=3436930 RepID=UPI003F530320
MPELSVPLARGLVRRTVRPFLRPRVPVAVQRLRLDAAGALTPLPPGAHILRRLLGGVPGRRVSVGPVAPERAVLYLHGGGYVTGSSRSHLPYAAHLARATRSTVYVIDYRRAPEHPYPAAVHDARAAWRALADETGPDTPMVVAGDAAGGGLALTVALATGTNGPADTPTRAPDALVMLSPWLDPLRPWPYEPVYHHDPILHASWLTRCGVLYADGIDRELLAPARSADLSGLPPTIVQNGTDDILAPESTAFAERARAMGVRVDHLEYPDLWHNFVLLAGMLAPADEALHDLAKSLDDMLAR